MQISSSQIEQKSKLDRPLSNTKEFHVQARWKHGRQEFLENLSDGRHYIGSSSFAKIKVSGHEDDLCGILTIEGERVSLKCVSSVTPMYVDARRLQLGDQIILPDRLDLIVNRTLISFLVISTQADRWAMVNCSQANLRQVLSRKLLDQMNDSGFSLDDIEKPEVKQSARLKLRKLIADLNVDEIITSSRTSLEQEVYDEVMGLGPLELLLENDKISEIMVNHRNQIYVELGGKLSLSESNFSSDQALLNVIERIVSRTGRRIDQSSPIVDARLLDGSRVNAIIPPLALRGPCLTIRRFSKTAISAEQLIAWGSMNREMCDFLRKVVCDHKNILISGGTGSGKTTLLNTLSSFIPPDERIVTVEDAAELQLQQPHVISLETRMANIEGRGAITIRDLVRNTLRMRPDRIIVGECRGGEALDMLQAMNTGHDGSMTTAHANSPLDMLRRLETMVLMAGMDLPLRAIREQIASAICIVVQQTRQKNGRRLVVEISWLKGLSSVDGSYEILSIFKRNSEDAVTYSQDSLADFSNQERVDLSALISKLGVI